jgi:subtilisin family serine protease
MPDDATPQGRTDEGFRDRLSRNLITDPLLGKILKDPSALYHVIIDPNGNFEQGRAAATRLILDAVGELIKRTDATLPTTHAESVRTPTEGATHGYIFATLTGGTIQLLVRRVLGDAQGRPRSANQPTSQLSPIYRIWEDTEVHALINRSVATVKADAAHIAFSARGKDIVWAVLDSGVDQHHPHFQRYRNLELVPPVAHQSFTADPSANPLTDSFGHGTHVAGIIAGGMDAQNNPTAALKVRDETGEVSYGLSAVGSISGMAPECKLVSLKVLDDGGAGRVSSIIDAIDAIQRVNDHGRRILIHGANLSVGYQFDPEWFGCGHSPLCVEVNRLVRSGVVVVVAAGNTGYGWNQSMFQGPVASGMGYSINDPGNADLAITVGSTHRDQPHLYGVSYFSSKGPTGDGRSKPDLVAPGERIISCATGKLLSEIQEGSKDLALFQYAEDSGTSMAAPHVSGVIAAFLSIRSEYIGEPEGVKELFVGSAMDLKRDRLFQGAGLVDLMKAIQSV